MIPRRFLLCFDMLTLAVSFVGAYLLTPHLQALLASTGFPRLPWVQALSPPPGWTGELPPVTDFLWILLLTVPAALLFLDPCGSYGPLGNQTYPRIIASGLVAPLSGLSVVALAMFVLKNPAWSRLFVVSFGACSGAGLALYRVAFRVYLSRRRMAGYYVKNVLLIGSPPARERLWRYFAETVSPAEYRLLGWLEGDGSWLMADGSSDEARGSSTNWLMALGRALIGPQSSA